MFKEQLKIFKYQDEKLWFLSRPVIIKRKAFRRRWSISLSPKLDIVVYAGKHTSENAVMIFLNKMKPWLEKNLEHLKEIKDLYPPYEFEKGEEFLFQGKKTPLTFKKQKNIKKIKCEITEHHELLLTLPDSWHDEEFSYPQKEEIRKALIAFYKKKGIEVLEERVRHWSEITNFHPTKVSFRGQKTLWGSCSYNKNISLNWKLIALPEEFIDYVIVHELCHIKDMSHSPEFWNLVEEHIPKYQDMKKESRDYIYKVDFLNFKSELHSI